jgi:hypothetical protein
MLRLQITGGGYRAMKIIQKISSFFNKIECQRRRLQRIAKELKPILSFGWTELKEIRNKKNSQRIGLMTECYSKIKVGEVLIRVILEPARKKNLWLLRGRKNVLVHLQFFPGIELEPDEKKAVKEWLLRDQGLSFPEDWLDLKPKTMGFYNLSSLLSQIQVTLEAAIFFAILPGKIREVYESFEETMGIRLPYYH